MLSTLMMILKRLIRIESGMEMILGELDALIPSMSLYANSPRQFPLADGHRRSVTNPDVTDLRKQLSTLFTDYDTLAKRIRGLPCSSDSSQHRVQEAVWMRAVNFMQLHMSVLQV